jgi:hypothetical protein
MTYLEYFDLHERLVAQKATTNHRTDPAYIEYTLLNFQRIKRWQKMARLSKDQLLWLEAHPSLEVSWTVLTEPWCGDAAPSLPIMHLIASSHKGIQLDVLLRDEHPELMQAHLTDGAQSIPKLIQRDAQGSPKRWGPRPKGATQLVHDYKQASGALDAPFREQLQQWYNNDKGQQIAEELLELLGRK